MGSINDRSAAVARCNWLVMVWQALVCTGGLLIALPAMAIADSAQFSIPAQPLPAALKAFATQAHMQLLYQYNVVENAKGNPVRGDLEKRAALEQLLRNTGLEAVYSSDNAATIRPISAATSSASEQSDQAAPGAVESQKEEKKNSPEEFPVTPPVESRKFRAAFLSSPTIVAPSTGAGVLAQTETTENSSANELATVVVSSTRLQNAGFDAPTPTEILTSADLAKIAQPNLFDAVVQLPALTGSTGTSYATFATSSGLMGLSSFSLHGFDPLRTLTLLDGERVVGSNFSGVVDVSLLPQMLIQRVDVVQGGASASWGSDAIAGVVNLVTDKKFDGFKTDVSYGTSTYDDNHTATFKMAAGSGFLDGRGHIEVAGEYMKDTGVVGTGFTGNNFGCGGINGRQFDSCAGNLNYGSAAATPAGQPQVTWAPFTTSTNNTAYGLITSGPLQGTAFGPNGTPYTFIYAGGGVPNGKGGVSGCVGGTCISTPAAPGDLSNNAQNATLAEPLRRDTVFGRVSFDLTPTSEIFATFNFGNSVTDTEPTTTFGRPANLSLNCGSTNPNANPYLPASIQAACTANGITSFVYGVDYPFPNYQNVEIARIQRRFVLGGDGAFTLFNKNWTWDTYAEYGESQSNLHITNIPLIPNVLAAINAIAGPNGTIECASATARAAGCVPFNIVGNVQNTAAALQYIIPPNGPYDDIFQRQEAFGATLNGKPFADWAGDISTAIGVDYRLENYHSLADPYGNGILFPNGDPYTSSYPANPNFSALQVSTGGTWYAGNYHEGYGQYDVEEVFAEAGIPLYKAPGWGSLDADLGARFEHYSQAGNWTTWKLGLVWDTPAPGVRLRATESQDLRAPNLSEAFAPNSVFNQGGNDPFLPGNPSLEFQQINEGNIHLTPETAKTVELGIVFQPEYIPGLRASADYYHIDLFHAIAALSVAQVIQECFVGNAAFCSQAVIPTVGAVPFNQGGIPTGVASEVFNLASTVTDGVDLEADYQFKLDNWGVPGNFAIRALGTKTYKFTTCPGIPGSICTNYAGALGQFNEGTGYNANSGTIPTWRTVYSEDYTNSWGSFTLIQRWFNAGTFSNTDIVCNPGSCPPVTNANYPTINYNHMPGAIYWDAGASFNVTSAGQIYVKVNNIANLLPPPDGGGTANINPTIYDVIGRMYYVGFRLKF